MGTYTRRERWYLRAIDWWVGSGMPSWARSLLVIAYWVTYPRAVTRTLNHRWWTEELARVGALHAETWNQAHISTPETGAETMDTLTLACDHSPDTDSLTINLADRHDRPERTIMLTVREVFASDDEDELVTARSVILRPAAQDALLSWLINHRMRRNG